MTVQSRVGPQLRLFRRILRSAAIPLPARGKMLTALPFMLLGVPTPRDVKLRMPGGPIFLGRDSLYIDAITVLDLWNDLMFPVECANRIVLDIGAHKGYFGAWALAREAAAVLSCEPQTKNFALLSRSQRLNTRRAAWQVERVAVGALAGRASLYISRESWAHSLFPEMIESVDVETVQLTRLPALLERVLEWCPGHEVVLKLNVEGAAGEILTTTPPETLAPVVEVHLDHEPGSPHGLADILKCLAAAGLDRVDDRGTGRLFCIRRSQPSQTAPEPLETMP